MHQTTAVWITLATLLIAAGTLAWTVLKDWPRNRRQVTVHFLSSSGIARKDVWMLLEDGTPITPNDFGIAWIDSRWIETVASIRDGADNEICTITLQTVFGSRTVRIVIG